MLIINTNTDTNTDKCIKHTNVNYRILVQALAFYLAKNIEKEVLAGSKPPHIISTHVAVGQKKFASVTIYNLLVPNGCIF
jgi:hypothetical protein